MAAKIAWVGRALCRQRLWPEAWFPESRQEPIAERAKAVCRACHVRKECLEAGATEQFGIWGGVWRSEEEVKKARKPKLVNAFGAMRRMQSLAALGWTGKDISNDIRRYTGIVLSPRRLDLVRSGDEKAVPDDVAQAISRSYRRLGGTLSSGNSSTNAVNYARSNGWLAPREWRGYDIDDPKVWPHV